MTYSEPATARPIRALDLFAGTGWGVACQQLGIEELGVEIMPEAIATREANGMETIYRDVWDGLLGWHEVPMYDLLIASPPCQTFSMAGAGAGRRALDDVLASIERGDWRDPVALHDLTHSTDPRTALVLTPLAQVYRDHPEFVVFEQVPPVLPVWEACAVEMRKLGYSVWVGLLNSEQYGVPQTRKRAVLIASLWGQASPPPPTHSRFYATSPSRRDDGVLPWVSMAEALGWESGELVGFPRRDDGRADAIEIEGEMYRSRDLRDAALPAQAVTEKARSWSRRAGTESVGRDLGASLPGRDRPTVSGAASGPQVWHERPATTVSSSDVIAGPGWSDPIKGGVSRQNRPGSVRVTADEAATLQSYPPGFAFVGSKTKRFLQIGNAVPPGLARAILAWVVGA